MQQVLHRMATHKGTAFVEILQNCNVFNDGAFDELTDKAKKSDHTLALEHGAPMVFGRDRDRGIRLRGTRLEVVRLGDGIREADLLVHDQHDPGLAGLIARMGPPAFPVPIGVIFDTDRPCYEDGVTAQLRAAKGAHPPDLGALLRGPDTWVVP
jgi:2-oxoglutarate ferredoxin oxidoreductase subunit beta